MLLNDINDLLLQMALEERRYFTPLYIRQRLNNKASEKEITELLLSPICRDIVVPNFEVQCPNGDTDIIVHDLQSIPSEQRVCLLCDEEYAPDPRRIWISFDFTDEYSRKIKKKSSQLNQLFTMNNRNQILTTV